MDIYEKLFDIIKNTKLKYYVEVQTYASTSFFII